MNDIDIAMSYAKKAERSYKNCVENERAAKSVNSLSKVYDAESKATGTLFPYYIFIKKRSKARSALSSVDKQLSNVIGVRSLRSKTSEAFRIIGEILINILVVLSFHEMFNAGKASSAFTILYYAMFVAMIVFIVIYCVLRKKNEKFVEKTAAEKEEEYKNISSDYYCDTCEYISEYKSKYGVIYEKYLNTYALKYIRETLVSKRASNLKEAVNLFEAYDQRQEVIRKNDQRYNEIIRQQQAIIQNQSDMRKQYNSDRVFDAITRSFAFAALMYK